MLILLATLKVVTLKASSMLLASSRPLEMKFRAMPPASISALVGGTESRVKAFKKQNEGALILYCFLSDLLSKWISSVKLKNISNSFHKSHILIFSQNLVAAIIWRICIYYTDKALSKILEKASHLRKGSPFLLFIPHFIEWDREVVEPKNSSKFSKCMNTNRMKKLFEML